MKILALLELLYLTANLLEIGVEIDHVDDEDRTRLRLRHLPKSNL